MESKQCFRCCEVKILTDYYLIKDKRRGVCKTCLANQASLIYAAKTLEQKKLQQEKRKLYKKLYDQKPESSLLKKEWAINFRLCNLHAEQEKDRLNYQKNRYEKLAQQQKYQAKIVNDLSLVYLNVLLGGSAEKKFPVELLEAKRVQVQIRRELMRVKINHQELTKEERV